MIIGLSVNKSKLMSALRKEDRPFPKIKDIKKVMNYYWKRDYVNHREHVMVTMMVMMYCSGVRAYGAIGLRWQDVQFDDEVLDNNIISINNSINIFERRGRSTIAQSITIVSLRTAHPSDASPCGNSTGITSRTIMNGNSPYIGSMMRRWLTSSSSLLPRKGQCVSGA